MNRPKNADQCGRCPHPFGEHYESYDGQKVGCSHFEHEQRDGGPCDCQGFALVQSWGPSRR